MMRRVPSLCRRLFGLVAFAVFAAGGLIAAPAALATCLPMAGLPQPKLMPATLSNVPPAVAPRHALKAQAGRGPQLPDGVVEITYVGHSSFVIRTPADVAAVTDYNGFNRPPFIPDIVTMNRAHSSHYTDYVEPEVTHVLRGWDDLEGKPYIDVQLRDTRVRNVPTNIRDGAGGTEYAGNSIFVFETAGLCIAHVGHLHHTLTPEQRGRIGEVDVLMVPIDDGMTMPQALVAEVVTQLDPAVVMPMHYFGYGQVQSFIDLMAARGFGSQFAGGNIVRLTKRTLPKRTVLVLMSEF